MVDEKIAEQEFETPLKRGVNVLVAFVVALLVGAGVVALLAPSPRSGESRSRIRCLQNLQNIGLAIHSYYTKYGCFPPAYTVDKQGRRMHSWRVLILEFLDHDLYTQYDLSRPWNSPANLAVAKKMKKDGPYFCPSQEVEDPSWTSYVMPVGRSAFSSGPTGRKSTEITDGLSNTIMVIEMSPSGILWTSPYDLNVAEMSFKAGDVDHPGLRGHSGGANALAGDGAVRFFRNTSSADEARLKAFITINGKEDMTKFDGQ